MCNCFDDCRTAQWELIADIKNRVTKSKFTKENKISFMFPIVGKNFKSSKIRLMIVGRASNGWRFNELEKLKQPDDVRRMSFTDWKEGNNYADLETCVMNKSPFWRVSRMIQKTISGDSEDKLWYESIIWANLCMAAPTRKGNPNGELCTAQLQHCRKILSKCIEKNQPTHILFITGDKGWFRWFNEKGTANALGFNCEEGGTLSKEEEQYVCRTGKIDRAKVVVAKRPDCRKKGNKEENYIDTVVKAFARIK